MYEGFCGERKHTPNKMCNVDAEYPYAHSYSAVMFIDELSLGTQPDIFLTRNTKSLTYTSLVRPVLEYGSASMQRRTDKYVRLCTEESCSTYKSYAGF